MTSEKMKYPDLVLPDSVVRRAVTIWSNGVRLDGDLYTPAAIVGTARTVPAVVMSHGLGGDKRTAERYASRFAEAGMIALTFSHSGCAGSDARVFVVERSTEPGPDDVATARVRLLRGVVDPLEWVQSFWAATDFIEGEPNVDRERIGAWGTSYGGGVAFHASCNDERIKCLAVQVAAVAGIPKSMIGHVRKRAIEMARGETMPVPDPGIDKFPSTPGVPSFPNMIHYRPLDELHKLTVPMLMVDAGDEEMFDIRENCGSIRDYLAQVKAVPFHYELIPGINHYGIYFEGYERGSTLARDWFVRHLQAA